MPTPLGTDNIEARLPEHYREVWRKIAREHLGGETIYFVEYLCRQQWWGHGDGRGLLPSGMVRTQPVIVAITGVRWIRGHYSRNEQDAIPYDNGWTYSKEFTYRRQGKGFFAYFGSDEFAEWKWLLPPSEPVLRKLPHISVTELSLAEVAVRSRNDYECIIEGRPTLLTEIDMGDGVWYTAPAEAGRALYELLRTARENKGHISGAFVGEQRVQLGNVELIDQLQQLEKLRQSGALSEGEFEELKNRLMRR